MKRQIVFICSLIFIFPAASQAMSVEAHNSGSSYILVLKGDIEEGDLSKIRGVIAERGYPMSALINSNGGDVVEAIKIGRFFNRSFMEIIAGYNCDSACFVLWAGAYKRATSVSLGLHRPYFDKDYFSGLSVGEAEEKYRAMTKDVMRYLEEMSVPSSFVDAMMSADSGSVVYIHPEQLPGKISEYSPAKREWIISRCGTLSPEEKKDDELIIMQDMYRSLVDAKHEDNEDMIRYIRERIGRGEQFSSGYRSYLEEKARQISVCEKAAIEESRNEIALTNDAAGL